MEIALPEMVRRGSPTRDDDGLAGKRPLPDLSIVEQIASFGHGVGVSRPRPDFRPEDAALIVGESDPRGGSRRETGLTLRSLDVDRSPQAICRRRRRLAASRRDSSSARSTGVAVDETAVKIEASLLY